MSPKKAGLGGFVVGRSWRAHGKRGVAPGWVRLVGSLLGGMTIVPAACML